jgi:hypothetical protein
MHVRIFVEECIKASREKAKFVDDTRSDTYPTTSMLMVIHYHRRRSGIGLRGGALIACPSALTPTSSRCVGASNNVAIPCLARLTARRGEPTTVVRIIGSYLEGPLRTAERGIFKNVFVRNDLELMPSSGVEAHFQHPKQKSSIGGVACSGGGDPIGLATADRPRSAVLEICPYHAYCRI